MDYELLLRIQHGFVVLEVEIVANTPIVNQSLRQSRPWDHALRLIVSACNLRRFDRLLPRVIRSVNINGYVQITKTLLDQGPHIPPCKSAYAGR